MLSDPPAPVADLRMMGRVVRAQMERMDAAAIAASPEPAAGVAMAAG